MQEIKASMAGTVLNVMVGEGDSITAGQELVMLESMKMEIPIEGVEEGTVTEVKVSVGDFVNEGDVLVTVK
ncbi:MULTISPECIES: biotin/lipoyl-binding carrier protein [Bacillaceae]|uniref:biotin/lipoyl-binding carrier protein n=1 Tax=Bacillales TaxID=1385 RepID=UPI0018848D91|nr:MULTISPECIES: biotin/lipoyl-binding carrier protein [Bacillaceae]MBF0708341.1 biotin/lipoyl-binding carrier protein [Pseudalkalibacillus hwajinpoensis]MDO6655531.1 biotin/lipoyl-binding carrier protein [Anaerobacillus sp. 1_MG-2023]WLR59658.1 biotin/lipoyl-binding carrier protein [Pseudalkalibacillus hwajinpoensis]